MEQREYHLHIRELQEELFPHLELDEDKASTRTAEWDFAMPSYHFRPPNPLLTEAMVDDLRTNKKRLLDVGCGPAYLEQLLTARLGIEPEQIMLADINPKYVPKGYKFKKFDIFKEWPELGATFDYVLFPAFPFSMDEQTSITRMYNACKHALGSLNESGRIRLSCSLGTAVRDEVKRQMESEIPGLSVKNYGATTEIRRS